MLDQPPKDTPEDMRKDANRCFYEFFGWFVPGATLVALGLYALQSPESLDTMGIMLGSTSVFFFYKAGRRLERWQIMWSQYEKATRDKRRK